MRITDKTRLLRALITTTKTLILEFNNCYLNIYGLGNTYFTKTITTQSNNFSGYLLLNNELIKILKDCCTKKSSELEFKDNRLYYKRTNKEELAVIELDVIDIPEQLQLYLTNDEFTNENLLTYKDYNTKLDTKYEFEVIEINNTLMSNKDLELVPKVFDIEFNKQVTLLADTSTLTKKEIVELSKNPDNLIISYEDLVFSSNDNLIQITNINKDIYFYCKICYKI